MDLARLHRRSEWEWEIAPAGKMRVPAVIYATEPLIRDMDDKVFEQVTNVAALPGIVQASYAMPDAHWGYGFPIGGVAAFDPDRSGVLSAGGVGFDIACGVRTLCTGLPVDDIPPVKERLADALFRHIPAGVGSTGRLHLNRKEMDAMLTGGAQWAVERRYGTREDLDRIEEHGCMTGAKPQEVSDQAKRRQEDEVGTLGSGNHYLEVQQVVAIYAPDIAEVYGLKVGDVVVSIHCGSRGLGHQIGTDFLKRMVLAAGSYGIVLPDRELACGPGHPDVPEPFRAVGQPVLIGGTMGTGSYILCGTAEGMRLSFGSACHGAGRNMSRAQATKKWRGREVVDELARRGILIRSPSFRGVAEEAPGAYKDVSAVVDATEQAKLARKVARLEPLLCVKG